MTSIGLTNQSVPNATNNIFIGRYAGADVTDETDLVIIGDDIRKPEDAPIRLGLNGRVCIGDTLFGEPLNLGPLVKRCLGCL